MPDMDTENAAAKNGISPQYGANMLVQRHFAALWAMIDAHKNSN